MEPARAAAAAGIKSERTVKRLQQKARDRGFDPSVSQIVQISYVEDNTRSGRPRKADEAKLEEVKAIGLRTCVFHTN